MIRQCDRQTDRRKDAKIICCMLSRAKKGVRTLRHQDTLALRCPSHFQKERQCLLERETRLVTKIGKNGDERRQNDVGLHYVYRPKVRQTDTSQSTTRKLSLRQVSVWQPCVYEDLFLPSHHCLTPPSWGTPYDINAINGQTTCHSSRGNQITYERYHRTRVWAESLRMLVCAEIIILLQHLRYELAIPLLVSYRFAEKIVLWVTLSFRNTKVLHQSVTPNNRFNT